MRLSFRHGIVSSQAAPFLFYNASGNVNLLASNKPLTVTIAHKTNNYLHSEDNTVVDAWTGTFSPTQNYYLYMEFDSNTFARTFGYTTEAPKAQVAQPTNPTLDTTWYNTATNEQFKWIGSAYAKVTRVFIARMLNRQFYSLSELNPSFYGTQIGSNQSSLSGRILYTEYGNTILRDDKTFFTSEDQFFTNQSQVIGVRLESNITTAKSSATSLSKYSVVALDINGTIRTAGYNDVEDRVVAIVTEDLLQGETGNIIVQGTVTNPEWDFSAMEAGTKLYVSNGTLIRTDPHISNPVEFPNALVPVAKVLSKDSVIFEQGLGGVGPVGPTGSVDNIPPATIATLGGIILSHPPTSATLPKVVSDNDPRLVGAPFASGIHTHPATAITVSTSGNLSSTNVQLALQELDSEKFNISGGNIAGGITVAGPSVFSSTLTVNSAATFNDQVILTSDPNAPLEAATKRYVDNLTSGFRWLDPVCLANLIGDDVTNPSSLTPSNGDSYILPSAGSGAWAGYSQYDVVRWNGTTWENGGNVSTNFLEMRFLIAGTSPTAPTGSYVGRPKQIVSYTVVGGTPTFYEPVNTNAVYICNEFSDAAFNQYVYDDEESRWKQTGGSSGASVTGDNLTIVQNGSTLSTISWANDGQVDAATYRGQDLDTVYATIAHNHDSDYAFSSHTHNASDILITPSTINPTNPAKFGTLLTPTDSVVNSANVRTGMAQILDKKATNQPLYGSVADLPAASSSRGMVAHVVADNSYRAAIDDGTGTIDWIRIAVNDGSVQNHQHRINYDLTFFAAGPVAANPDIIIGRSIIPRNLSIPPFSPIYARVINPPSAATTFTLSINGNPTSISVTIDPAINGGISVTGDSGAGNFTLNPGDYVDLVTPTTTDSALTDLAISLVCVADTGTP